MARRLRPLLVVLSFVTAGCAQTTVAPVGGLGPATGTTWELVIGDDGAPEVRYRQATIVTSHWVGWGQGWQWADVQVGLGPAAGTQLPVRGAAESLGLRLSGHIERQGGEARYQLAWTAARALAGITGVALEFGPRLGSPALAGLKGEPELLPDQQGWRWAVGTDAITVRIEPAAANCYFERGRKDTIRCFLLGGDVPVGTREIRMTVSLPAGGAVLPTSAERYGPTDTSRWYRNALPADGSPVDLSDLNDKPAGRHGFVQARGDDLVFADGTPVRFWGGNLAAYALFVPNDQIDRHARRIAQLGYNLMRLHHHDSTRWVSPTVIDKSGSDSRRLDERALDRLDYWVKALKEQGVYVWLDLHVGREFKPGDVDTDLGRIDGYDEVARQNREGKGFCYYNRGLQALMREFNEKYLRHVNRFTGQAYLNEPAVMGLLLTNENDVTHHFGNLMLGDKGNPKHHAVFTADVRDWCQRTGLPYEQTWRTWENGPSKLYLNEVEQRLNRNLLDHLLGLGVKVPVATTNYWGGGGIYTLPALTCGGIIDVHSYGGAGELGVNPRAGVNFATEIVAAQVAGRPLSVTEWNVPYPTVDRFTAPLQIAAMASRQGWDAPMIYNYSQDPLASPSRASTWSSFSDPALTGLTPAAALAFRAGHLAAGRQHYHLKLNREQTFYAGLSAATSATIRTLAETSRLTIGLPAVPELPWLKESPTPAGAEAITDAQGDYIPAGQTYVVSDNGEVTRDWVRGIQLIDTARSQAAIGWIGGHRLRLTGLEIQVTTPQAVVVASSLDGQPLAQSRRILLTALARAVAPGGQLPFLTEPVVGRIRLRGPRPAAATALAGDGRHGVALPVATAGDWSEVTLTGTEQSHWFELTR